MEGEESNSRPCFWHCFLFQRSSEIGCCSLTPSYFTGTIRWSHWSARGAARTIPLAICPFDSLRPLWWTPLVFDPGCALLLVACLIAVLVWGIKRARDR